MLPTAVFGSTLSAWPPHRVHLHLRFFDGGNAAQRTFKFQQWLPRLHGAFTTASPASAARFVHLAAFHAKLRHEALKWTSGWAALLTVRRCPWRRRTRPKRWPVSGWWCRVWAPSRPGPSKATDIAHNVRLVRCKRVERLVGVPARAAVPAARLRSAVRLNVRGAVPQAIAAISARPHDRKRVAFERSQAASPSVHRRCKPAAPLADVDVLGRLAARRLLQLQHANWGLALGRRRNRLPAHRLCAACSRNPTDVELMMFAQANSEHCPPQNLQRPSSPSMVWNSRCRCSG